MSATHMIRFPESSLQRPTYSSQPSELTLVEEKKLNDNRIFYDTIGTKNNDKDGFEIFNDSTASSSSAKLSLTVIDKDSLSNLKLRGSISEKTEYSIRTEFSVKTEEQKKMEELENEDRRNNHDKSSHNNHQKFITRKIKFLTWLNHYRSLLFSLIIINSIAILYTLTFLSNHWEDQNFLINNSLSLMVIGNLFISSLVRNEWILRFIYWISINIFRYDWVPKRVKISVVGILYHIGGLHSGCGVSALMWLVLSWIYHSVNKVNFNETILGSMFLSIICVLISCFGATPIVREKHHNFFETSHRFFGWTGIIMTLIFIISSKVWDPLNRRWKSIDFELINTSEFWLVIFMIVMVISSWITVVEVLVDYVHVSEKATVIKFPNGLTSGLHTRISLGGLKEWHIFGSISEGRRSNCHYLVVAVQGDFTKTLNNVQPPSLYTKTWKPCGLPYFSRLFKRGLAICTGSGIGAIGSTVLQNKDWYLIWIGSDLEKTYGKDFIEFLKDKIEFDRRLIWDTRVFGRRPDVSVEIFKTFKVWKADVTLFIGSPNLNKEVLRSCRAKKVPVFGSIWDA